MVNAVRSGESQRSVAKRFGVSMSVVHRWVKRAGDQPLDNVNWHDRPSGPSVPGNRTPPEIESLVLDTRQSLRQESLLGEHGAVAIHQELVATHPELAIPSVRTIGRILERHGVVDQKKRLRHPAPPRGWYLPEVAEKQAELDQFDIVEGLKIKNGPLVEVLNGMSLWGRLAVTFVTGTMSTLQVRRCLCEHWQEVGLPSYAQFDNDTIFQGPHQHRDIIGSVIRMCLSLGVIPVFVPPRECGFQAVIENYNGLWQAKVWARFHHPSVEALQTQSAHYVSAHRLHTATHRELTPERRPFPEHWTLDLSQSPQGTMIFLRRTTDIGNVFLLGRSFFVASQWLHRLVRCEVDLIQQLIRFHQLRRCAPQEQPLINEISYHVQKNSIQK